MSEYKTYAEFEKQIESDWDGLDGLDRTDFAWHGYKMAVQDSASDQTELLEACKDLVGKIQLSGIGGIGDSAINQSISRATKAIEKAEQ